MGEINIQKSIKIRAGAVRARTWVLTIVVAVVLVFYLLMQSFAKDSMNVLDFIIITLAGILTHFAYFPDGELFGEKDKEYANNKTAYNKKATLVNKTHTYKYMREYCEVEYEERRTTYINETLSEIGIIESEYEWFKQQQYEFVKKNTNFEIPTNDGSVLVVLAKGKKRKLMDLLYEPLPIEKNDPTTIMSAIERKKERKLTNKGKTFKEVAYISKILMTFVIGLALAYTGLKIREGLGVEQIALISMFVATVILTAITSFSSGEICTRVFKKQWYIDLSLFLDGFNEWLFAQKLLTNEQLSDIMTTTKDDTLAQ